VGKLHPWSSSSITTVLTSRSQARHYASTNVDTLLAGAVAGLISLPMQGGSAPLVISPHPAHLDCEKHGFRSSQKLSLPWTLASFVPKSIKSAFLFASSKLVRLPEAKSAENATRRFRLVVLVC
jgi:hypothetical protein